MRLWLMHMHGMHIIDLFRRLCGLSVYCGKDKGVPYTSFVFWKHLSTLLFLYQLGWFHVSYARCVIRELYFSGVFVLLRDLRETSSLHAEHHCHQY